MPNLTLGKARENGPLVEFAVAVSEARAGAIKEAGLPPVLPEVIHGLLDTGAFITIIDEWVVSRLGLAPTGAIEMKTPATGEELRTHPTFDIRLEFVVPERLLISDNLRVAGALLPQRGLGVLIGRDVLSRCVLIYKGPMNQFTISY
jgi:hypothetical protein